MTSPEEPVTLTAYDELWPKRFAEEHATLSRVLEQWLVGAIEHVGSTAVPGLIAKPVIDIMAGVESLEASRAAIPAVGEIGYCYFPYRTEAMHWFCKPSPFHRTHHLHLIQFESRLWFERLAFRDYLRSHCEVAAEYAELKRRFAAQYHFDREAYTEAKSPFIERIVKLALDGTDTTGLPREESCVPLKTD
jgi:GrpB-like predicted nucleotidyltransferase (UPF0157 family)